MGVFGSRRPARSGGDHRREPGLRCHGSGLTNRILDSARAVGTVWLTPRERQIPFAKNSQRFETVRIGEFTASARSRRRPCRLQPAALNGAVCASWRPFGALWFEQRARGVDPNGSKHPLAPRALSCSRLLVYRFWGSGARSERLSILAANGMFLSSSAFSLFFPRLPVLALRVSGLRVF